MNQSDFSETDLSVPRAMPAEQLFPGKPGIVRKGVLILVPGLILVVGSFAMAIIVALRVPSTPDRTIEPGLNSGFLALIGPPIFGMFIQPLKINLHFYLRTVNRTDCFCRRRLNGTSQSPPSRRLFRV